MTIDQVKQLADGKIYSGEKAQEIGLVDKLGTLDEAIISCAELAELSHYDAIYIGRELTFRERIFQQLHSGSLAKWVAAASGIDQIYKPIKNISEIIELDDPGHMYAHSFLTWEYMR